MVVAPVGGDEDDGEDEFHDDEGEFHPEGDAEDSVLAVVETQLLVFPADEDGGNDVSSNEEKEEDVV